MVDKQIELSVYPVYQSFMLGATLDKEIVNELNEYIDDYLESDNKTSHADKLVGQIKEQENSGQWTLSPDDPRCQRFSGLCREIAKTYEKQYQTMQSIPPSKMVKSIAEIDELWSVHSYKGDYNILHNHAGGKYLKKMAIVAWLKVPECISKLPTHGPMHSATGNRDGFLEFVYGVSDTVDIERFKFSNHITIKPEVGRLLACPAWTPHLVYPFSGEGERRTIACNVSLILDLYKDDQSYFVDSAEEVQVPKKFKVADLDK